MVYTIGFGMLQAEIGDLSRGTESHRVSSDAADHFEAAIDCIESEWAPVSPRILSFLAGSISPSVSARNPETSSSPKPTFIR